MLLEEFKLRIPGGSPRAANGGRACFCWLLSPGPQTLDIVLAPGQQQATEGRSSAAAFGPPRRTPLLRLIWIATVCGKRTGIIVGASDTHILNASSVTSNEHIKMANLYYRDYCLFICLFRYSTCRGSTASLRVFAQKRAQRIRLRCSIGLANGYSEYDQFQHTVLTFQGKFVVSGHITLKFACIQGSSKQPPHHIATTSGSGFELR